MRLGIQHHQAGLDILTSPADRVHAVGIHQAKLDMLDQGMVKRLVELGRVEVGFDPITWADDMAEKQKACGYPTSTKSKNFLAGIDSYGWKDYNTICATYKATNAYLEVLGKKPVTSRPLQEREDWRVLDTQATLRYYRSTVHAFESPPTITSVPKAEKAEGNRYLTYLYWHRASVRKKRKSDADQKEKGSKAPATKDEEDPDEE